MNGQVCLIPGLGVDERMFAFLPIDPALQQTVIKWVTPLPQEKLEHYAARLLPQVPVTENLILIGVSFGGILAVELAKLLNPILVIIIFSIKTCRELPWYYKPASVLRLPYLLPIQWGKYLYPLQNFLFGVTSTTSQKLLRQMIREMSIPFVRWALTQIAGWQNITLVPNLIHFHGTHDKLFPIRYLRNFTPIPDGGHLMVVTQGAYLSKLIDEKINSI